MSLTPNTAFKLFEFLPHCSSLVFVFPLHFLLPLSSKLVTMFSSLPSLPLPFQLALGVCLFWFV